MPAMKFWVTVAAALGGLSSTSAEYIPREVDAKGPGSGVAPCDALQDAGLGDRVLFPTDPNFEPEIETWPALNTRLRPYCLVMPHNTEEVATALNALVNVNGGAGDWHIAVRSGGHGPPGSNGIERGVTIDLSQMNTSSYDHDSNIASIQPGARWRNVYADLQEYGVAVAGGRDGGVGVGGFLLGGGMSYFTPRLGLGCDSVVNYEVVLANATIINANKTSHEDLWRALKGGGNNFGIVTRFDMEAFPSPVMYYDMRTLDFEYADAVLDTAVTFAKHNQSLSDNALITYISYQFGSTGDGNGIVANTIYVNTAGEDSAATAYDTVKGFPALSNVTTRGTMADLSRGGVGDTNTRNTAAALAFHADPQLLRDINKLHTRFIEKVKQSIDPKNFMAGTFFQSLPSYLGDIGKDNMLGLNQTPEDLVLFQAGIGVDGTDQEFAIVQTELLAFLAQVKELTRTTETDSDFIYLNYAYPFQNPLGSYGPENTQHIRDVATAYDSNGVFQRRIPGGFKISRV